jgi:hypothetical protein
VRHSGHGPPPETTCPAPPIRRFRSTFQRPALNATAPCRQPVSFARRRASRLNGPSPDRANHRRHHLGHRPSRLRSPNHSRSQANPNSPSHLLPGQQAHQSPPPYLPFHRRGARGVTDSFKASWP